MCYGGNATGLGRAPWKGGIGSGSPRTQQWKRQEGADQTKGTARGWGGWEGGGGADEGKVGGMSSERLMGHWGWSPAAGGKVAPEEHPPSSPRGSPRGRGRSAASTKPGMEFRTVRTSTVSGPWWQGGSVIAGPARNENAGPLVQRAGRSFLCSSTVSLAACHGLFKCAI